MSAAHPAVAQVWRRFFQNVWLKLRMSYSTPDIYDQSMNRQWLEWAGRLPRSSFVVWLAGQVANDLIANKRRRTSITELIVSVSEDRSGMIQHDAEHFIETYFFDYPFNPDPHLPRLIAIFRRIVNRRLSRYVQNDPLDIKP